MLVGRQGFGLEIDPACTQAYDKLYTKCFGTEPGANFDQKTMYATPVGQHFFRMVRKELEAETTVIAALENRRRRVTGETLGIGDYVLLLTQLQMFRNHGLIFLKFCNEQSRFGSTEFKSELIRSKLDPKKKKKGKDATAEREDVDSFDGMFAINDRAKVHIEGFQYRAMYLRYNEEPEERRPGVADADDVSIGLPEGDEEEEEEESPIPEEEEEEEEVAKKPRKKKKRDLESADKAKDADDGDKSKKKKRG